MTLEDAKQFGGWIVTAAIGAGAAIRWWYSLRRVQRGDSVEAVMSNSVAWMLKTLKDEVDALKKENSAMRDKIEAQASRIAHLEGAAAAAGLPV